MERESNFQVRYLTEGPVPISDIIESLMGTEAVLQEMSVLLPEVVDGLVVQGIDIRVREISQNSPLRELFVFTLFMAYQKQLEEQVPTLVEKATGLHVPSNLDTTVTVLCLVLVFYGAGALKDLVFGKGKDGATKVLFDNLVAELAAETGKTPKFISDMLENRFGDPGRWKRLATATSRFFRPSKQQDSAPVEVNHRVFDTEVIREIPADYLVEHEGDALASRRFDGAVLDLRLQDRDNKGKGWAAIIPGVSEKRIKVKLLDGVNAADLWGQETVIGDINVIYERVGMDMVPREVHLTRLHPRMRH